MIAKWLLALIFAIGLLLPSSQGLCADATHTEKNPTLDNTLDAAEADDAELEVEHDKWNEYDGKLFTLRFGTGFVVDTAAYVQNAASKEQVNWNADAGVRDFRVLFKGKFKFAPRISYSIGYMYDGQNEEWRFRQTGLMLDVPELNGNFFFGRTKEGFSTNKVMVGYYFWTIERSTVNDAFLPILADGVKWIGRGFGGKLVYNLGYFSNVISPNQQNYAKNASQFATRAVWVPNAETESETVLHVATEYRYGTSLNGNLQYRSKPESFLAQSYVVDTGVFSATASNMAGFECYYRPGPLMFGSEYFLNWVNAPLSGNPFFHGGEIFTAYLLTGEIRKYNESEAYFEPISPSRSVFKGGPGAWELVLRYSYIDLNSGDIQGGRFWRLTPMVNWHLSDNARFEFVYGYGVLDRFGLQGGTQFFQTRLQLTL